MKKKSCGKALTMLLVASLAASTVLAGCGKKKVDYMDEDGSSGGGSLTSRLAVPESYQGTLEGIKSETGLTEVKIDVSKISVPDTDKMSVNYYEQNVMDSAYKKRVCESIYDVSAGVYAFNYEKPYKGDIEREIESFERLSGQVTGDDEKSYFDEYINSLKEQLKTATDEREGAGDYTADAFLGSRGSNMYMITFNSTEAGVSGGFSIDYYPSDQLINYKPKEGAASLYCYSSDYYDGEDMANTASISKETAIQDGINFLTSCGIADVMEVSTKDLVWEYSDSSYNPIATEKNGYVVTYKRSVDGVAPYTPYVDNIDSLNSSQDTWYDTMDESFELNIDDNGIVSCYCYDYYKATGEKKDNVDLVSWKEALEALPEAVNTYYTENKTQYSSITFNDVELTYYKIKDGDKYEYTPVWVFAQCENAPEDAVKKDGDADEGEKLDTTSPTQLILLDAVTGKLINLKDVLESQTYSMDGDDLEYVGDDGDEEIGDTTEDDALFPDSDAIDNTDGSIDIGDLGIQTDEVSEEEAVAE